MHELPSQIFFFEPEHVIETHSLQLEENGGGLPGLTNAGMGALQSALSQPRAGSGGVYFHPTLFHMAAAYMYHLANGHCFLDGNKRTALAVALDFLGFHGVLIIGDEGDEINFLRLIFRTVSSGTYEAEDLPAGITTEEVNEVLSAEDMKQEIAEFFQARVRAIAS